MTEQEEANKMTEQEIENALNRKVVGITDVCIDFDDEIRIYLVSEGRSYKLTCTSVEEW
jgi:hypothetical protein